MRTGDRVDWTGALYALQEGQDEWVHVGGRTALEMQGFAHYAAAEARDVFLFAPPKSSLPPWFTRRDWGARIVFTATSLFSSSRTQELVSLVVRDYTVRVAPPEQAALEMLFHVPQLVGFDEASQIMAGLGTVRPTVAQKLLEQCGSIKAKRLFLYFAKSAGLAWLSSLDVSRVNLGSGNRQIIKGGSLDKEYRITVPQQPQGEAVLF